MNATCPACRHVLVSAAPTLDYATNCTSTRTTSQAVVDFNTDGWVYDHHDNDYYYDDSFLSYADPYDMDEETDPNSREFDYPEETDSDDM